VRANKNPARQKRTGLDGVPGLRVHGARFRGGNEPCVHRFDCPVGGSFCAASCRVVCAHSLPQETSAGRNLITLFRTVNNFAHFFFRQVGMASSPSPFEAARPSTTTPVARTTHRRHAFRKPLYLRHLRKRIDVGTCSMPRSHRCVAVATDGRRGCARHQKKISGDALVSRRTIPICAKVRELRRAPDDRRRRSRTSRRGCRRYLRDARDATGRRTCIASNAPRRWCSNMRSELVGDRVATMRRHRRRALATGTLTGPSPIATRPAYRKKQNRPHMAAGP
jgi:hypothetical protein